LGFVATLRPDDEESVQKIAQARTERSASFATLEEPIALADCLSVLIERYDSIVVDDLTTWVSNLVMAGRQDPEVEAEAAQIIELAAHGPGEIVIVTSDVDFGFPVDEDGSRAFRRLAGLINRRMAEAADRLYWMVFGAPNRIR
jgi:adenosyl cobinamide kinase/adenosyl cobinamide phosphate guanylyltransferase